jgi:hypothetical protein
MLLSGAARWKSDQKTETDFWLHTLWNQGEQMKMEQRRQRTSPGRSAATADGERKHHSWSFPRSLSERCRGFFVSDDRGGRGGGVPGGPTAGGGAVGRHGGHRSGSEGVESAENIVAQ